MKFFDPTTRRPSPKDAGGVQGISSAKTKPTTRPNGRIRTHRLMDDLHGIDGAAIAQRRREPER